MVYVDDEKKYFWDSKSKADKVMDYEIRGADIDDEMRIRHNNMLWLLYRILSEDVVTSQELDNIGQGLSLKR